MDKVNETAAKFMEILAYGLWLMSVKLNRPPKPEESHKNSNFNGKAILYTGFECGTSGLADGNHNHRTIGSVIVG
jgi:hypothetical protein